MHWTAHGVFLLACTLLTTEGGASEPRSCPCSPENLWLDLVFVLDASEGVGLRHFDTVRGLITSLINLVPIGQGDGQTCRVAFIVSTDKVQSYGDLTTYKTKEEALAAINSVKYTGGQDINIRSGLTAAYSIVESKLQEKARKHVRTVVIYIGATGFQCGLERRTIGTVIGSQGGGVNYDPCTVAAQLVGTEGTTLITLAMEQLGAAAPPRMDFSSKCFNLTNENDGLSQKFVDLLCKANCYCPEPLVQVKGPDECSRYGECVYKQIIPVGYRAAQVGCQLEDQSLADVLGAEKEAFLNELANDGNSRAYYIGLQRDKTSDFTWDNEARKHLVGDYENWAPGEPKDEGACVFEEKQPNMEFKWKTGDCTWDEPSYYYFCQQKSCDTDNYCDGRP